MSDDTPIMPFATEISALSLGTVLGWFGGGRIALILVGVLFVGGAAYSYGKVVANRDGND